MARSGSDGSATDLVARIVVDALEQAPEDLVAFLNDACGEDQSLRDEVEALLEIDRRFEGSAILEVPVAEQLGWFRSEEPAPLEIPDTLGPYRLIEQVGKGGMGLVYRAEQEQPVRRQVALKVMRVVASERWKDRFAMECQTLARLNHPNIATLFEVRIDGAEIPPYVVMEFVDGPSITRFCNENRLSIDARLRLFLKVCAGVGHAHEKGVLHCDLKPSNVLISQTDRMHEPKVIDFGIARALNNRGDEADPTLGAVSGTPPYISPEALEPDGRQLMDSRTDVYALGVLLYELLAGVLPHDRLGAGILAMVRRFHQDEPPRASARLAALAPEMREKIADERRFSARSHERRLRGDLDAIIDKAISRDRADRYGTPAELAQDIECHLDQRPIRARLPDRAYVLRRFLRRHAAAVTSGGLAILALTVSLVFAVMGEQRASRALAESEQVSNFMLSLFEGADPEQASGEAITVIELLDQGKARLSEELRDQPEARARFLTAIGSIYTKLGELQQASDLLDEALRIQRETYPEGHPQLVASEAEMGIILRRLGRYGEAEPLLRSVVLARKEDADVELELLARAHSNLGNLYWSQERFEEAEVEHRAAYALRQENTRRLRTSAARSDEAISANNLGVMLLSRGQNRDARPFLLRAIELFRTENPALLGSALTNLGLIERRLDTWQRAEALFREAIDVQDATVGTRSARSMRSRHNLAMALSGRHEYEEAMTVSREAVALTEEMDDVLAMATALRGLGRTQAQAGLFEDAARTLTRCVDALEVAHGADHAATLRCRTNRAAAFADLGDRDRALEEFEAIAEAQRELPPNHPARLRTDEFLGLSLRSLGDPAAAEIRLRRVLEGRRAILGPGHLFIVESTKDLAAAIADQGRLEEAAELYREALELAYETLGDRHPSVAETAHELGIIEERLGDPRAARKSLQLALHAREAVYPPDDADLMATREALERLDR
ncbi:MAG: serine/threonine-protein kinase [Pseudomonadota bacterium]